MTQLPAFLARTAVAASLGLSTLALAAVPVSAQEREPDLRFIPHEEVACMDDGTACATYRCDITGDCVRITEWRAVERPWRYRGYHSVTNVDDGTELRVRCDADSRCASFRCDEFSNCERVSDWR